MDLTIPLVIASIAAALLGLGAVVDDRRTRAKRLAATRAPAEAEIPLLHSINDDRCIGCEACIDVCPTEVLDLIEHKVRVSRFSDCVQCEQCANACPTMALVMYREGTTPSMLTVPELDDHFQTGIPGQYLIGEVAGKPLVKNAANLGRAVIEHVAGELAQQARPPGDDVLDVVIVGSGPGGLSAGLTCIKRKLSCIVLEKEHVLASTVARYPKGKHFMAEPSTALNVSYLPVFDSSKEELVAAWQQVVEGVGLAVKLGEAVETVERGADGVFSIRTTVGTYRARRVVLATGLRGKPRLLVVPGANLEKVGSLLADPAEHAGLDVLVVGGGDSAVEGAMALAAVGARVTLSYRGDGFKRCKQGNQKRLAQMTASGELAVLLESNVAEITPDAVAIKVADGTLQSIANQRAFIMIGADTPVAWLEANHVRFIERPHLYTLGASDDVVRRHVADAVECPRSAAESVALVLGHVRPARAASQRARSVVGQVRHGLRAAVEELSGAFKLADLAPRRPARPLPGVAPPIPPHRLVRRTQAGPPAVAPPIARPPRAPAAKPVPSVLAPRLDRRAPAAMPTCPIPPQPAAAARLPQRTRLVRASPPPPLAFDTSDSRRFMRAPAPPPVTTTEWRCDDDEVTVVTAEPSS